MLKVGDVVFLKSDIQLKHPMTVTKFDYGNEIVTKWINSQGKMEVEFFKDSNILMKNVKFCEVVNSENDIDY